MDESFYYDGEESGVSRRSGEVDQNRTFGLPQPEKKKND